MNSENQSHKQQASFRMKMSQEYSTFLKRASQIFGDIQFLIGRNLTPTAFWFFIDAFYFQSDNNKELDQLKKLISSKQFQREEFDELQDLQFILKLRNLVSRQKFGTLNIQDIKSTPIDEVIEVAQSYLQFIETSNNNKLKLLKQRQQKQKQTLEQHLANFNVQYRSAHPMFYYQQFQAELTKKWMEQDIKLESRQKCYLCSLPNRLITCNSCSLKVHPDCYPTFSHRYDNKNSRPTELQLKKFTCETCNANINTENLKCQVCCCLNGHFLKTNLQQINYSMTLFKQENQEDNNKNTNINIKITTQQGVKPKFIHLACFIWNTQLKWNINTSMVEGTNKSIKKKNNGICSLCGVSFGISIPCSNESCRRFYHGQCAKRHKLEMKLLRAKTSSIIQLHCERHRQLNRYQAIQQAEINKFKQVKKMFEGLDKQIKRIHVTSSYQQIKLVAERDYCSICGKQQGWIKITTCKQCRKWYHNTCSQTCKNCA